MIGEKVMDFDCGSGQGTVEWTVDCGQLDAGVYYLEIDSAEKTYRTKFIKR